MIKKDAEVTIVDIAREAGTSPATVSRIINDGPYRVNPIIRERVLSVIQEHNYSPNPIGRMLKKRTLKEIGVAFPTFDNPFYMSVLSGIERAARDEGYDVIICCTNHNKEDEIKSVRSLISKRIHGLIIASTDEDPYPTKEFAENGMVVSLDQRMQRRNCISVDLQCRDGARKGAEYLFSQGHRNVAYITMPLTRWTRRQSMEGFLSAFEENGIPFPTKNFLCPDANDTIEGGNYEFECGKLLAKRLLQLDPVPTAVMAVSDIVAFGAIRALHDMGVRIPEDISVIGYDNILFSSMISPALTTLNSPSVEIGQTMCRALIEKMEAEEDFEGFLLPFDSELVIRHSVKQIGPSVLARDKHT